MAEAIFIEKSAEVIEKTFTILKQESNTGEYLIYLQIITPRLGDATRELQEKTGVFDGTLESQVHCGENKEQMRS